MRICLLSEICELHSVIIFDKLTLWQIVTEHFGTDKSRYLRTVYSTNFFLRSSGNRVYLLSYESKTTDKQGKYDWKAEKNLGGT